MENINFLIKNFEKKYKRELYYKLFKLIPVLFFVIICPIAFYKEFLNQNTFNCILLLIAEIFFIVLLLSYLKSLINYKVFHNSNIFKCIQNPDILNIIIIEDTKLFFDIDGIEDETIYLTKDKNYQKIIEELKNVFGDSKIKYS